MRNEEKFIRDILISTQKGKIEWKKYDLPQEASGHFDTMYFISKGVNPGFKISVVKMKGKENPYAFFVILNEKLVMSETSAELENPYTLATLFLAAKGSQDVIPFDIEEMLNKIPLDTPPCTNHSLSLCKWHRYSGKSENIEKTAGYRKNGEIYHTVDAGEEYFLMLTSNRVFNMEGEDYFDLHASTHYCLLTRGSSSDEPYRIHHISDDQDEEQQLLKKIYESAAKTKFAHNA